ncbi:hypothetical protein CAOG_03842 [Capsaspora owczarzaki ATCC 30864]|uniref:MARVEL domain-containing protein n=1 Tax=Capsaspora owczarzaki (strain ATCC 30864) TaxID=595528 RepID=A0A0D2X2Q6_CAPO3|nr:hypothetical protein CAOG_03842 [Capsaspora owczarzaki ATCC 30864]KJE92974.1 hypothetical protein CAOG_003842 [Capsaspora owczarzaki ATCC 30864]|eukprot:XP_004363570.1 hypothetical protein CAOG_03842 [Capsaspora owczarzaki ATCC 30864]
MAFIAVLRFIAHFLNVICGCIVAAAVGVTVQNMTFAGNRFCILFSDWKHAGTLDDIMGSITYCDFLIAAGIICLAPAAVFAILTIVSICRKDTTASGWSLIELIVAAMEVVIMLAAGIVATAGLKATCDSVSPLSCSTLADKVQEAFDSGSAGNFYNNLLATQAGAWISTVSWAVVAIINFFRFRRYSRSEDVAKQSLVASANLKNSPSEN